MKGTYTIIIFPLVLISLQLNYPIIDSDKRPPIKHVKLISNPFMESQSEHNWIKTMEEKYMKINKRIYDVCQKAHSNFRTAKKNNAGGGMKNNSHAYLQNFIIDKDHHLGYCGHPKVASTSTMHFFYELMPSSVLKDSARRGEVTKRLYVHKVLPRLPVESIYNISMKSKTSSFMNTFKMFLKQKNIMTFTFVRHPYERLVSAYKDKVLGKKEAYKMIHGLTFPEFIEHVLEEFERDQKCTQFVDNVCFGINLHWRPFNSRCLYCNVTYDVIGTGNSYNDDMRYLILKNKLGHVNPVNGWRNKDSNTEIEEGRAGTKQHARSIEAKKYFTQLNKFTIRDLHEMYAFDFELFDYDTDGYEGSETTQKNK